MTGDTPGDAGQGAPDELRLALVLNGGVSLAVWISGVVSEIDALRFYSADDPSVPNDDVTGEIYASLKDVLRLRVVVDIVAGTSAGGLNGALLAAGIATRKRVSTVRNTWLDAGQLGDLLRRPSEIDPPSLLQGDKRLLTAVRAAIAGFFDGTTGPGPCGDVQATLTATDLFGIREEPFADSYGDVADRTERRLRQRFTNRRGGVGAPLNDGAVDALARAARTSASFPFAFEPSQLEAKRPLTDAVYAYQTVDTAMTPGGVSRWAMDGGVLDNSPIDVVLDDIVNQPVRSDLVRRTIVFVVPYLGQGHLDPPKREDANLRRVLSTTINSPRDLPDLENLDRVREHLHRRDRRRREAENVLLGLPATHLRRLGQIARQAAQSAELELAKGDPHERIGRRALQRIRDARAGLPIPDGDAVTASRNARKRLGGARASLRSAQEAMHDAIWRLKGREAVEAVAAGLMDARAAIDRLQVSAEVKAALLDGAPEVTADRLEDADAALTVLAGVTEEEEQADAGFRFMRLCADARHIGQSRSNPASRRPTAKLYGLELGHFAGFVRRSWRANDWMWGRLDGAARIVDLVLSPTHIHDHPISRSEIREALCVSCQRAGLESDELHTMLVAAIERDQAEPASRTTSGPARPPGELADLVLTRKHGYVRPGAAGQGQEPDLPCDELEAWRHAWRIVLQTAILRAELPRLTAEVASDRKLGFRPNPSPGVAEADDPKVVVSKFHTYCDELGGHIPEIVADERNSRQGARLLASAGAVAAAVLGSRTSGLPGLASAAVRTTSGAFRALRFAVQAMTGSVLERTAFVAGVALAGLAVGISAVSDLGSSGSGGSTSTVKGIALAVAVPILAVAVAGAWRPARRDHLDRIASMFLGLAVTFALFALVVWLWAAPLDVASQVADAHQVWWVLIVLVALSAAVGWVATVAVNWRVLLPSLVVLALVGVGASQVFDIYDIFHTESANTTPCGWHPRMECDGWSPFECNLPSSYRCEQSGNEGVLDRTEVRLAIAAVASFVLAALVGYAERLWGLVVGWVRRRWAQFRGTAPPA